MHLLKTSGGGKDIFIEKTLSMTKKILSLKIILLMSV